MPKKIIENILQEKETIQQFFEKVALKNKAANVERYEKLKQINAPEILIESTKSMIDLSDQEYVADYIKRIKNYFDDDGQNKVVAAYNKTGNGGKKYLEYHLESGEKFNFFPRARYGMIIFPCNK